jgi:hypothetical protein
LIVAVSNVGKVKGWETVQVYVKDEKSRLPRPEKELVAFEKVGLEAGETRHLRVGIDKYAVGYFDTAVGRWVAEEGVFRVLVAASAADVKYVFTPVVVVGVIVLTLVTGMMSLLRLRRRFPGCFDREWLGWVRGWRPRMRRWHLFLRDVHVCLDPFLQWAARYVGQSGFHPILSLKYLPACLHQSFMYEVHAADFQLPPSGTKREHHPVAKRGGVQLVFCSITRNGFRVRSPRSKTSRFS